MPKRERLKLKLTERDFNVLKHVRRQGMTIFPVVHRLYLPGQGKDAVKSLLRRLCGKPPRYLFLRPEPLCGQRVYYRLTPRAAHLLGAKPDIARPLGPQALIERYAILWFVAMDGESRRTMFNPRDLPDQFDVTGHRLPRSNFYIEEDDNGDTTLGYLLVDHGGHPRRIVRKAATIMLRFLRHGWFNDYIATGQFCLTLLTISEGKRESLVPQLTTHLEAALRLPLRAIVPAAHTELPLRTQVLVVPELIQLVPGRRTREEAS